MSPTTQPFFMTTWLISGVIAALTRPGAPTRAATGQHQFVDLPHQPRARAARRYTVHSVRPFRHPTAAAPQVAELIAIFTDAAGPSAQALHAHPMTGHRRDPRDA